MPEWDGRPPDKMVDERPVAALHRATRAILDPDKSRAVMVEAGLRTGDYILCEPNPGDGAHCAEGPAGLGLVAPARPRDHSARLDVRGLGPIRLQPRRRSRLRNLGEPVLRRRNFRRADLRHGMRPCSAALSDARIAGRQGGRNALLRKRRRLLPLRREWDRKMKPDDETVILVDEDDREVGSAPKLDVHRNGWRHRAISVCIVDSAGRMLLQRRASGNHSGGLWTNACCTHPRPGEQPDETPAPHAGRTRHRVPAQIRRQDALSGVGRRRLVEDEVVHLFAGEYNGAACPSPRRSPRSAGAPTTRCPQMSASGRTRIRIGSDIMWRFRSEAVLGSDPGGLNMAQMEKLDFDATLRYELRR